MDVSQVLELGPLQIPVNWLILLIGLIIATVINERIARQRDWDKGKWSDLVVSALFIFIIISKFGWIFFDLKRVINNPSSVIWTSGSTTMSIMAFLAAILYMVYTIRKKRYSFLDFLDYVWITFTVILFLYNLIIMDYGKVTNFIFGVSLDGDYLYHPVNWYKASLLLVLLFLRFKVWKEINNRKLMQLYLFLGAGLLFVSVLDISINLYFGLTIEQWGYLILALTGSFGLLLKK